VENMEEALFILALSSYSTNIYKEILSQPEKVFSVNFPFFRGDHTPTGKVIKWANLDKYKFKFLFVGRIDVRKNIEALIKAFNEEFGNSKDVCLILKIYSPDINVPLWLNQQKLSNNIFWLKDKISNMSVLYRSVNAYICTDLGEAWGGPCTEAMLCGIPTIAPRHSGHLDYMRDDNSYLIDVEDEWKPIGKRKSNIYENLLPSNGLVKYPILDSIKEKMRETYNDFKGLSRKEVLNQPKIKKALDVQKIVDEKTVFNNLDRAFNWVEKNYPSSD
jgi:glycosyltransferase involved in cell wall biosynthesis